MTDTQKNDPVGFFVSDEEVAGVLLHWSGLAELWEEYELDYSHDFFRDVVEFTTSIDVEQEYFYADRPGASEVNYRIRIRDPERARKDLLIQLQRLLKNPMLRVVK